MKLVIQRVKSASIEVEGKTISEIGLGILVLLGVTTSDTEKEADFLVEKLAKLRIMARLPSPEGEANGGQGENDKKMNYSIRDVGGEMLIVSQFTLYGDTKGGNRPSFIKAARPEIAKPLYDYFIEKVKAQKISVQTGQFGADMKIKALLDGPVTIILEQG